MKTRTKSWWAVLFAGLLFVGACDSFSDLSENPNNPESVPERLQLPALQSNFSYQVAGNTAVRIPSHWIKHLAWSGAVPSEDNYDVDGSDVNNLWEFWTYPEVLNNARELAQQAEENENYAYAGIAKIIHAWTLSIVTDLWGDVPYSEAFDPVNNTTPAYDEQEQIYEEIFALLDEGIEDLNSDSNETPGGSVDLLYGGDLGAWERLAHTLKARFHMRLSEAPDNTREERAQQALQALQNGFMSNSDDADFQYYSDTGSENPWYQFAIDGKWDTRDQLSAYYVDTLKALDDPRLSIQARPVGAVDNNGVVAGFDPEEPEYEGQESGLEGEGAVNVSSIGAYYSAADAPLNWISYASSKFVEAEARLITEGAAAAEPVFEDAIRANMDKLGVAAEEAEEYIASRPDLGSLSFEEARALIMYEKYVANFINVEAYNDWRRTGYPEMEPVENEARVPIIPLRFPPPSSELARNADNVQVPAGHNAMLYPVWWDTTVPPEAEEVD